jgi:hypothetical protein
MDVLAGRSDNAPGSPPLRAKTTRSRATNRPEYACVVDGRSAQARRFRDIAAAILIDQGGPENCTEARIQLVRRFSATCVLAEQLEARVASGEQVDVSEHALLCSTLHRLAGRIGIDRVPRDVSTPTLDDIVAEHEAQREAVE